jgi:hypothetical protein
MLIYDRRRCRPPAVDEMRRRLTIPQRARLGQLEGEGWRLLFVRGEPAVAFISHATHGYAMLPREGRQIAVRSLPLRTDDGAPSHAEAATEQDGPSRQTPPPPPQAAVA